MSAVDPARLIATVKKLESFGTRHTLSDTTSPVRGIGAARAWIKSEMERVPGLEVAFDAHTVKPDGKRITREDDIVNVVGVLPGQSPDARARRYYVVGHYDSRATDVNDATSDAPGANDDASGVAVVLELARVMSAHPVDATLVFLATAGEEQGLFGAKAHAEAARAAGIDVRGVLNDDIVGDPSSPDGRRFDRAVRVFADESESTSRALGRFVGEVAAAERVELTPEIIWRRDRLLRGGDHLPFQDAGFPAVRFTTVAETYERQHQNVRVENGVRYGDVSELVDAAYLARVARLQAAVLAHLANAPSVPGDARLVVEGLSHDALVRWNASPEADVVGYEIVWRRTSAPDWEHARDVKRVTEARLPLSKDDLAFGVRAYDAKGYRSPVALARPVKEDKTP